MSQELTQKYGKGYTYSALTRMSKMAKVFNSSIVATLSQQLSWSHLIELSGIEDDLKREFFTQLCLLPLGREAITQSDRCYVV